MSHDDFAFEPVRGLPARLPKGESLLWQGAPRWQALAVHAYHVRKLAIYFAVLAAWRIGAGLSAGEPTRVVATSCLWILGLGLIAGGLLSLLAYLAGRTTVYSVTSGRIVIRFGVAFPMTINVPFGLLDSAAVKLRGARAGDVALRLRADQRLGFLITWPHVRPWHINRPQPCFRALADARGAADVLAKAMLAFAGVNGVGLEVGGAKLLHGTPVSARTAAA